MLLDHTVKHWSHAVLSEVGVGHTNDGIEVLSKYAVLTLYVPELLTLDKQLGCALAVVAATNPDIVLEEVAR